jgi:uncharacterized protein
MLYKLSKYNYSHEGDNVAIFNTFSGAVAILSSQEYHKMSDFKNYDIKDSDIKEWVRLGFIVEENVDETKIINYHRFENTFSSPTNYRILTTSECNARCFYCYEDFSEIKIMDNKTANIISEFIIKNSKDKDSISISWFGGEPLMNPNVITTITENVVNGLKPYNVNTKFDLTTNGSLFTDETIHLAKTKWNIRNVQISLDGMKENHELRKKYVNITDSFDKTLKIIKKLLDEEIHVTIRLNFDKNNFDEIIELINFIKLEFGVNKHLNIYGYPLYKSTQCESMNYINSGGSDFYLTEINDALLKNSFMNLNDIIPKRRKVCCSATSPSSYVIDANGDLYKCSMDMKNSTRSIGSAEIGVINQNIFVDWCMPTLPMVCDDCIALPLCQGGCRANRILCIDDNYCFVKKHGIKYYVSKIFSQEDKYESN